ncbi:MinD/ParA family ATP-binding protein [Gephyromycinifex aptenodytis]|uniref:MinD/ParA family ATP-binding protein n=1 Tax=Gephyromycinifex aptenodytis TaxID=2716227 RepID=UPI001D00D4A9|nr:MinD/ParA family protein [Gephyromycinifex aptenodytis]
MSDPSAPRGWAEPIPVKTANPRPAPDAARAHLGVNPGQVRARPPAPVEQVPVQEPAPAAGTVAPTGVGQSQTGQPARARSAEERAWQAEPTHIVDEPMIRPSSPRPRSGWRALAYGVTGGLWNPGISAKEEKVRERERQIATQLRGRHVTAFFCLKGGISKTSTTAATSIALSDLRPDPVFAIDANPDAGDLAERLLGGRLSGIAALAAHIDQIDSLEALSRYTATTGRLTVLPGEPNPILGDSISADDFERVMRVVQQYYSFVQVDCGTGVTHPLMEGVLRFADTAVIPAAWSITGAKRAGETIEWLLDHGFESLAKSSIVVLTAKDIVSSAVNKEAVMSYLSRAADVIVVPADPHVADGALIEWEALQPKTQEAYLDIAAAITRRFDTRRFQGR